MARAALGAVASMLSYLLAGALTDPGPPESKTEPGSWAREGVVLPRDSAAAKLHGRPTAPAVDRATRARILEHFESTRRRVHAPGPVPAA